jgi:hypothetical protein
MSSEDGDFGNKMSPQKESHYKNEGFQEKTYYLSKIVEDGGCIHCLNNSCRNRNVHGIEFPEKLSCFVKNPRFITEVSTAIENASLNFDNIPFNITTCTFIHTGNCKNCNEGRYKTFDMNGKIIGVCFPAFDETKTKIIVGIHMDIKIIMRGKHYAVSALPILESSVRNHAQAQDLFRTSFQQPLVKKTKVIKQKKESTNSSFYLPVPDSLEQTEEAIVGAVEDNFDFSSVLNIYENSKQKRYGNIHSSNKYCGEDISRKNSYEGALSGKNQELAKQELSLENIDEFPSLGNTPCSSPSSIGVFHKLPQSSVSSSENTPLKKNFADIIKSSNEEKKIVSLTNVVVPLERVVTPMLLRASSPKLNEMKDKEEDMQEFNRSPDSERSFTPITADGFEGQNIILKQRLEVLRKENAKLKEDNKVLEITNTRNMYVIENQLKIGEFLKNRNLLNNNVIEQFFNTHYGDYLVLD